MTNVRDIFYNHFKLKADIAVQSPGRINLIGEHTDYNNGFVLPAAINKTVQVAIAKRTDHTIQMFAVDLNEVETVSTDSLQPHAKQWVNYIIGVVAQLPKSTVAAGFSICVQGDIPIGAGLSSSAAVECAVIFALNELYQLGLYKDKMALMAQAAEHAFAGVKCGIMDMFASLFGKKDQVILLDCAYLTYQYYPLDLKEYEIVLFDTQIKHALASSEYNTRRLECEQGVRILQQTYPAIQSLRDASVAQIEECLQANEALEGTKVFNRCKYVVAEIERVQTAVIDLQLENLKIFGEKMFATHEGLSKLYEVSCPELDLLVNLVASNENVIGARMMGGGFGGCTINIIKKTAVAEITASVRESYLSATGKFLQTYQVSTEEGTHLL